MSQPKTSVIKAYALRLLQPGNREVFLFSLRTTDLLSIATLSRIGRDKNHVLTGYQRPATRKHVADIRSYLEREDALFPNSVILAMSPDVYFRPDKRIKAPSPSVPGVLNIPISPLNGHTPAWVVDGQQRLLALSQSSRRDLAVPLTGFISADVQFQRDQFFRINNTKPLPRGLVHELLPTITAALPAKFEKRKVPSLLCDRLNQNPDSPFFGLIRRVSTPKSKRSHAVVTDTSLLLAVEESLHTPAGCLFSYHNIATGEVDVDEIEHVLTIFWNGVRACFPQAWGLPPDESRLMHGVGIRSMGRLMNRVMTVVDSRSPVAVEAVVRELEPLKPCCRWTSGHWRELGNLAWNELQNNPQHIRLLATYLEQIYLKSST